MSPSEKMCLKRSKNKAPSVSHINTFLVASRECKPLDEEASEVDILNLGSIIYLEK